VRLHPSNEEVEVRASELGELRDAAAAAAAARGGVGSGRPSSSGRGSEQERERSRGDERARERARERDGGKRERDGGSGGSRERSREHGGGGDAKRHRGGSRDRDRDRDRGRERERERERDRRGRGGGGSSGSDSDSDSSGGGPPPPPARPTWLFPSIRVRVLDKRLHGGGVYLKKGIVVDVHPGGLADVALPEGKGVVQLPEALLETVVPKEPGRPVQVVAGHWRGRRGRLLQASAAGGAAAVQLVGDMAIVRLQLDDVAEYTGALDEEDE
jgi:G patch domain/KOW motif-containing protein